MKRALTTHHDGHGLNESLQVEAVDGMGPGGARHLYTITTNPVDGAGAEVARIQFQKGPRGVTGSTPGAVEASVLAIVRDRLESFQAGPYPSDDNAEALLHIVQAMACLKARADKRATRGVLGTNAV